MDLHILVFIRFSQSRLFDRRRSEKTGSLLNQCEASSASPATEILLGAMSERRAQSWLLLGGDAWLALGIATDHPDATVRWQPSDFIQRSAVVNPPDNLWIDEPGAATPKVDGVVIAATPNRDLA